MPWSWPGLTPDLLSCPSPGQWAIAGFFLESLRFDCLASLKAVPWAVGWALPRFHRQHNSHPPEINRLEPLRIQRFHVKFGFLASLEILEDVMFDLHRLNCDTPCRQGMAPVRQQKAHEPAVVALNHLSKLWPPLQSPTWPCLGLGLSASVPTWLSSLHSGGVETSGLLYPCPVDLAVSCTTSLELNPSSGKWAWCGWNGFL